jgi:hypothetical protein
LATSPGIDADTYAAWFGAFREAVLQGTMQVARRAFQQAYALRNCQAVELDPKAHAYCEYLCGQDAVTDEAEFLQELAAEAAMLVGAEVGFTVSMSEGGVTVYDEHARSH